MTDKFELEKEVQNRSNILIFIDNEPTEGLIELKGIIDNVIKDRGDL